VNTSSFLIKGDSIVGCFTAKEDGLRRGYEEHGQQAFLVREIAPVDVPIRFDANRIGI